MNTNHMEQFGFKLKRGGAHLARTMMLEDMEALLVWVNDPQADRTTYARAIQHENCLGKRSAKTRKLTAKHLVSLYGLDPSVAIFRNLLFFWGRDPEGHSLLALLCAYARDPLLRMSAPFILGLTKGTEVVREKLEAFIEAEAPDRFSKATLKSLAQNIDATWTKSGHLRGRRIKVRIRADATPGAVFVSIRVCQTP